MKFAIVAETGPERRFDASKRTPQRSFSAMSALTWNHAFVFEYVWRWADTIRGAALVATPTVSARKSLFTRNQVNREW
jgi:hypothetical protein